MATKTIGNLVNEDDEIESYSKELLDNRLLTIFNSISNNPCQIGLNPHLMLREAYWMCQRVEKEKIDDKDFHDFYITAKERLGTYQAATICMGMLYAILTCKDSKAFHIQALLHKIYERYRLRPWMKDVQNCIALVKDNNSDSSNIKITVQINDKNMDENKKAGLLQGMFQGATFNNSVVVGVAEKGSNISYQGNRQAEKPKVTKEHIARALIALNGKDNVIDSQRAWLGACLLLGWKYGFPRNLNDCCKQIDQMPIDMEQLEFQCKYDSIRMYGSWKFVKENYDNWPTLVPRDDERPVFEKCLSVAQALDEEIVKQMEIDAETE